MSTGNRPIGIMGRARPARVRVARPPGWMARRATLWALAGVVGLVAGTAHALEARRSPEGHWFIEGGVTHEERQAMVAARSGYRLWVLTAARGSGAWLADVEVTVRDVHGTLRYHGRIDGPWLMLDLPPGVYRLEAALAPGAAHQTQTVRVTAEALRQVFFYFDTGDEVADEGRDAWNPAAVEGSARRPAGRGPAGKTPRVGEAGSIEP